ncbi:MAG: sulfur carrier protein ThiS [Actinomycetota bacterium]|nr:sulfur carrier protein ThiS [Actinomycetota bacterium]
MNVTLNGQSANLRDEATVFDAVLSLNPTDAAMRGVAVAVNGEVVSRAAWRTLQLHEDDRVEVLRAVGGG